ncbi:tRNA (adenosine(37)-N6)-threonylcarbamoyltransferase complex ATPase subunit type 1 TsaE [Aquimarina agarivorans]|uniref:tRNA (adenosine(37)-N6)-threonylcarbamoyltransferase complex ATPase subunit type 1 TsaE n=1 Tax=Aquimarina agarivorans TaxID=980584 RepID=UPI000248ED8A|nr:tRNA (adenosine(37)-N6)-threonylcarbamoyltransferase complex ATPase subunit type 1 TsaE [Aquimarina agarivorans]
MEVTYDLTGLHEIAKLIIAKAKYKTLLFNGEMGAGKTTLIKAICEFLGVKDVVSSPTFALVNEYEGDGNLIYHFDFYRIQDEEEAYAIGFEEYEYTGDYLFIEWSENIPNLIPEEAHIINITIEENGLRKLFFDV